MTTIPDLEFTENKIAHTLGVEMELQVLDALSLRLIPKAASLIEKVNSPRIVKEMFQSTLEIITGVCGDAIDVGKDLNETLQSLKKFMGIENVKFSGTGTNPVADYNDRIVSAAPRYYELLDRNQWLIRRMAVYGLHVHIGMKSGDECIRYNNFFLHLLPQLIALSASSPFWKGRDTGLSSSRPTAYTAHPTSGMPHFAKDWKEFVAHYKKLLETKSIQGMKDIWWDLRPSPGYGTLEIRICDGPATMHELQCITTFIQGVSRWFEDHGKTFFRNYSLIPESWILRENKWRAIRHGMDASYIDHATLKMTTLKESICAWVKKIIPYMDTGGEFSLLDGIREICERGNSSTRQRKVFEQNQNIEDVIAFNVREFENGRPIWTKA